MKSSQWFDRPNALEILDQKKLPKDISTPIRSLIIDGVAVIKNANSVDLCDGAIRDYQRFSSDNKIYVDKNLDELGREKRLVNFHLYSDSALKIAANEIILTILDQLFESEVGIYTSLTFKYGTQQPVHRDTPHFATWPPNSFVGVWTALESIHPSSGPIFYHPGAHKFELDQAWFYEEVKKRIPEQSETEQLLLALDLYNGEVIRRSPSISKPLLLNLEVGDTVVWHPQMPHGGSIAEDKNRTRWSMVVHCAPNNIHVYQHEQFFLNGDEKPLHTRYELKTYGRRKVALAGLVQYM
jgi:phytanoyl-CoA hydroxylase